jgi:hypothetical protein
MDCIYRNGITLCPWHGDLRNAALTAAKAFPVCPGRHDAGLRGLPPWCISLSRDIAKEYDPFQITFMTTSITGRSATRWSLAGPAILDGQASLKGRWPSDREGQSCFTSKGSAPGSGQNKILRRHGGRSASPSVISFATPVMRQRLAKDLTPLCAIQQQDRNGFVCGVTKRTFSPNGKLGNGGATRCATGRPVIIGLARKRYHIYCYCRGLALPGGGSGPGQPTHRRLIHE